MKIIEIALAVGLMGGMLSFFVAGIIAVFHIDKKKAPDLSSGEKLMMGPLVSEKFLSEEGLRWAKARNVSVLVFALSGILLGVHLNLLKK
jgi:hypothetical protein